MLRTRLLTAALLIPIVGIAIWLGGVAFLVLVALVLTAAEVEFCQLVRRAGYRPALGFGVLLLWVFLADAHWPAAGILGPGIALALLSSLTWQLGHREGSPVADWALAVSGGFYLGVCGACLLKLRGLGAEGLWWMLTALPSILVADTAAYSVGKAWGRRKLAPRLSPGKTWEGYAAGLVVGPLVTFLLAALWSRVAVGDLRLSGVHGVVLGLLIALIAPLGDLAISMVKRSVDAKDSGNIIPGHGGALDRVDSVLWAGVIGYYYALWLGS